MTGDSSATCRYDMQLVAGSLLQAPFNFLEVHNAGVWRILCLKANGQQTCFVCFMFRLVNNESFRNCQARAKIMIMHVRQPVQAQSKEEQIRDSKQDLVHSNSGSNHWSPKDIHTACENVLNTGNPVARCCQGPRDTDAVRNSWHIAQDSLAVPKQKGT